MRSEFYVITLIKNDEQACRKVARHLGLDSWLGAREVIIELYRRNRHTPLLTGTGDEIAIFEELQQLLDAGLSQSNDAISENDLSLLLEAGTQKIVGKLLDCSPSESLQLLFLPDELHNALEELDIGTSDEAASLRDDSEWLLSVLLDKKSKLHAAGITDLFGALNDFMRPTIRRNVSHALHCQEDEVLEEIIRHVKIVKPRVPSSRSPEKPDYDIIALSSLRTYLQQYRESLLRSAMSDASTAKMRLPGYGAPAVLGALIDYGISRRFKSGLSDLLSAKQLLRECKTQDLTLVRESQPDGEIDVVLVPSDPAVPAQEEAANEGRPARVDAEIRYRSSSNAAQLPILKLKSLTNAEFEQIQTHLPKTCKKLSSVGDTLQERVRNTAIPIFSRWRRMLHGIMADRENDQLLDDSFVQCFVLAGVSFDAARFAPAMRVPDQQGSPVNTGMRVEFPKGPDQIAAELEEEYRQSGRAITR